VVVALMYAEPAALRSLLPLPPPCWASRRAKPGAGGMSSCRFEADNPSK